jgi:thymidylate synthase
MIAAVEALQLIAGTATPRLIVAASPAFAAYREANGEFWGAYGSRIGSQTQRVVDKLRQDADSRQAIISLWSPTHDNTIGKRDYPCTLVMGFRIRNRRLNMSVTMRSNDLWLGTCYDVFQFTQLQLTIAHMLGVDPGTYTHTAWSLHIYERDLAASDELHLPRSGVQFIPDGLPSVASAASLLEPPTSAEHDQTDPAMRWYRELVQKAYTRMNDAPYVG